LLRLPDLAVQPGPEDEPVLVAHRSVALQLQIGQRSQDGVGEMVEPPSHNQRRNAHPLRGVADGFQGSPDQVVSRMRKNDIGIGQLEPFKVFHVFLPKIAAVVVVVVASLEILHRDGAADQVGRMMERGLVLNESQGGAAPRAHTLIRPGLPGNPLDAVEPVQPAIVAGHGGIGGTVKPAPIHNHVMVVRADGEGRTGVAGHGAQAIAVLVVGRLDENDGFGRESWRGVPEIGVQRFRVARGNGEVGPDQTRLSGSGVGGEEEQDQTAGKGGQTPRAFVKGHKAL